MASVIAMSRSRPAARYASFTTAGVTCSPSAMISLHAAGFVSSAQGAPGSR